MCALLRSGWLNVGWRKKKYPWRREDCLEVEESRDKLLSFSKKRVISFFFLSFFFPLPSFRRWWITLATFLIPRGCLIQARLRIFVDFPSISFSSFTKMKLPFRGKYEFLEILGDLQKDISRFFSKYTNIFFHVCVFYQQMWTNTLLFMQTNLIMFRE